MCLNLPTCLPLLSLIIYFSSQIDLNPDPGGPRHLLVVGVLGPELAAGGLPAQVEVGQPVQEAHPPGRRVADPGHGGPAARARGRRGAPWLAWGAGIDHKAS